MQDNQKTFRLVNHIQRLVQRVSGYGQSQLRGPPNGVKPIMRLRAAAVIRKWRAILRAKATSPDAQQREKRATVDNEDAQPS